MKAYRSVPFTDVDIGAGFWRKRQQLNRVITVYAVKDRFMETGRFAALACDWREGQPNRPHIFWDSDIAKWMESVAYLIEKQPMPELEKIVEETIDQIELNQDKHGYVNSYFTGVEPGSRWTNRTRHELYCAGHLIEAAIAWKHATGRDRFLKIMERYADYIERVFVREDSAAFATPGHQEIELALVKLYHATGNAKYLNLSRYFVDKRGDNEKDRADNPADWALYASQSHLPAREQFTAEGHSVRACYFYSAMADIARECDDAALKSACEKLFDNITLRRMYLTAGIGSTHNTEAFTIDYDLPNETAYTETCAAIALAYFAHRMLKLDMNAKYADIIERVLYNGFLCSTSLDGDKFYYTNPMEVNVSKRYAHPSSEKGDWLPLIERVKVFNCSCCPPNITRFVASVGDYLLSEDEDAVYIHQYMGASAKAGAAEISIETDYPADGTVRVHAEHLNGRAVALRIPGWCERWTLDAAYTVKDGYAYVEDAEGKTITLTLHMTARLMEANSNVAEDAGKVAVMRGPVVYCVEGADNGDRLFDCRIDAAPDFAETDCAELGLPLLTAKGWQRPKPEGDWLYRGYRPTLEPKKLLFRPYFTMENRGETDMRVWIPVRE